MKVSINLNETVRVRLTQRGKETVRKYYHDFGFEARPKEEDKDGWSQWQLWDLMTRLSGQMFPGAPQQIRDNEILIVKEV